MMDETATWDELTRFAQRALIKMFGGGTLRNEDPLVVEELRARGLVDDNEKLSMPGLQALTHAMRKQQANEGRVSSREASDRQDTSLDTVSPNAMNAAANDPLT
jgi:hypothetical protein